MKFFKLFLFVFLTGSLIGVSCNLKSIEETQEAAKSPAEELLNQREADIAKKEADLKKREAALEEKMDEGGEDEEESEDAMEDEAGSEEKDGEDVPDGLMEDLQEELNERDRKILIDFTVETGDNDITILLLALSEDYPGDDAILEIGCQDVLVPLKVDLEEKTQSDLATAVVELLLTKRNQYRDSNGLVNHISGVGFTLANVSYEDGKRIVDFEGEPKSSGTCESPRITSQIEETVALYSNSFEIRLNGSAKDWRCLFDESDLCE